LRIVQLSDTHISHLGGISVKNFWLLIDYINDELHPDLVINTGDVVILNPDSVEDREAAWRLHQRVDAPLRVLPGNHDVGDTGENPWMGLSVTSDRIAGFREAWGADRFVELGLAADDASDWAFVGINSQAMSSGLPEEAEHWEWLENVATSVQGKSVMLFLHKPLWFPAGAEPGITIAECDRERIISTFAGTRLRIVSNGHVHRYRQGFEGDLLSVWAPSLTFASPPDPKFGLEASQSGVVEYRIEGDTLTAQYRSVPALRGAEDILGMPEFATTLAQLEASMSA
jgi:3',5'-cyclic AMP phosphodiesterase CpdA